MKTNRILTRAAFAALAFASSAYAAQTYDDSSATNAWNTSATNWGGLVWENLLTSDAIFGGTGESVAVTTVNARDITFNSTGYTLTGSTITLGAASNITVTNSADTATISSVLAGAGTSLTKSGAGTLTLSTVANTYAGQTIVNAGTLTIIAQNNSLQNTSSLVVNGGTLEFKKSANGGTSSGVNAIGTSASNKDITVKTGGTLKTSTYNPLGYSGRTNMADVILDGGTFDVASQWTYIHTLTLNTGGQAITSGGGGAIAFWYLPGSGDAITANADALISSRIHLNGGAADASGSSGNQTFSVASGKTLTISGNISNFNNNTAASDTLGGYIKAGDGTLLVSGTNNYGGTTTVSVGTLKLGSNSGLGAVDKGTSVTAGAVLDLNGTSVGAEALTLNGTGISSGGALINSNATAASLGGAVTLASASSINTTGNITLSGVVGGATSALTKTGNGTLTLSNAANTYGGGSTVNSGILAIGGSGSLGSGALSFTAVGTGLTVNGTAVTLANNIALPTGGTGNVTLLTPNNSSTVLNGTLSGGGAGVTLFFQGGDSGQSSGALTLNGSNTGLLGTINVQRGPLILGNANAAGSTQILLDSNNNANGALQLAGNFTIANNVKINYLNQRIGVGTGISAGISGVISENSGNGLEKVGAGTLTLSGTNTYTGATTVNAGTLVVNGNQTSATGAVTVNAGRLEGTGILGGATTVKSGATHSPGVGTTGAGAADIQGFNGLTYEGGSIFEWQLNSTSNDVGVVANSGDYDKVILVTGALGGSGATFKIVTEGSVFTDGFWDDNKSWNNIFLNASSTPLAFDGIFSSFSGTGVAANGTVTGQGQFTINGSTLNWTAVPEPTSAVAGLLLGAGLLRRRRKA